MNGKVRILRSYINNIIEENISSTILYEYCITNDVVAKKPCCEDYYDYTRKWCSNNEVLNTSDFSL